MDWSESAILETIIYQLNHWLQVAKSTPKATAFRFKDRVSRISARTSTGSRPTLSICQDTLETRGYGTTEAISAMECPCLCQQVNVTTFSFSE